MFTAFVMIHAQPARIAEVAQAIANLEHVAEVYSVTGDFDILVILRPAQYEQLAEIVPQALARIDGVVRTRTILAFRRFSRQDQEAAWDIGLS